MSDAGIFGGRTPEGGDLGRVGGDLLRVFYQELKSPGTGGDGTGLWLAGERRSGGEIKGTAGVFQPIAPAPSRPRPQTASEAAHEAVKGWLQATKEEATAIAESLQAHAEALRHAMQPREGLPVEQAAWREARRNYVDGRRRAAGGAPDDGPGYDGAVDRTRTAE